MDNATSGGGGTAAVSTEWVSLPVSDGSTLPVYIARPEGTPKAGLIVLQEAFGVNLHIRDLTERFAREGYLAAAPALFHRTDPQFEGDYNDFTAVMPHMQAVDVDGLTADMRATYEWLLSPIGGGTAAAAVAGYCMGGYAAFLAALTIPVKAAVSFYGGGIAPNPRSGPNRPPLLERIDDLNAPILLVWGGKDQGLPPEQTRAVEDALIEAGKSYTQAVFSEAGHGFFCDQRTAYHPESAKQAWPLTLAFLETYLS